MTPLDIPGARVLGRPVKPVALGYVLLMTTITVVNLQGSDVLEESVFARLAAVVAGASALLLTLGWWGRSQWAAEYGLLLAAATYLYRAVVIALGVGPAAQGLWLSLGACIIAAGSFVLERADPRSRVVEQ